MKKIINKIKANKNLCIGLNIFKFVLDCLVYGFTIFMIIGLLIVQSNYNKESKPLDRQLIPSEVVTPVKNAIQISNNLILSPGDFQSPNFYLGLSNYFNNVDGFVWSDVVFAGRTIESFYNGNVPLGYVCDWAQFNYQDVSNRNESLPVYGFTLDATRTLDVINGFGQTYRQATCHLYLVSSNETNIRDISFDICVGLDNSRKPVLYGIKPITYNSADFYFIIDNTINNTIVLDMLDGDTNLTSFAYEQGYNKGVSDISTQNEGIFGLFRQAFSSIASIFTIQLLPGFTLATLLIIPLIVMVIIVLFKMFRG